MPFKFRVIFSGICAFAPHPDGSFDDLDPGKRPKAATVVLPDLILSEEVGEATREPHLAFLEVPGSLEWTGREPNLVSIDGQDIFMLRGQRVSFRFNGAESPGNQLKILNFEGQGPADPETPAVNEERFFWWVPKMEKVSKGGERIRADFVDPEKGLAASWIILDQGELSSEALSARIMDFKPIGGRASRLRQRLAYRIAWEVEDVDSVAIVFTEPGVEGEAGEKILSLSGDEVPETVTVLVKNREIHDLLRLPVGRLDPLPDVDFDVFYDLSATVDPIPLNGRFIPHAVVTPVEARNARTILNRAANTNIRIQRSHIHGGVCPPTAFSGIAAAQAAVESRTAVAKEKRAAMEKRSR